jgi:hypothetical protein
MPQIVGELAVIELLGGFTGTSIGKSAAENMAGSVRRRAEHAFESGVDAAMVVALSSAELEFVSHIEWSKDVAWVLRFLPALLKVKQAVIAVLDVLEILIRKKWIPRTPTRINVGPLKECSI